MPTSRLPIELAPVPDVLIELSRTLPIYCNLRPEQRPVPENAFDRVHADLLNMDWYHFVETSIIIFLKKLAARGKVVIHFQGYLPDKIGTMVVSIHSIYWGPLDEPRLDFIHPEELKKLYGCPNFWGSFILAITAVSPEAEVFCREDKNAEMFMTTARQYSINIMVDCPEAAG